MVESDHLLHPELLLRPEQMQEYDRIRHRRLKKIARVKLTAVEIAAVQKKDPNEIVCLAKKKKKKKMGNINQRQSMKTAHQDCFTPRKTSRPGLTLHCEKKRQIEPALSPTHLSL